MEEMNKINAESLESVTGGKTCRVNNTSAGYANIREAPSLNAKVLLTMDNGQDVSITGDKYKNDGYVWYKVILAGEFSYGWIAGSLIGF